MCWALCRGFRSQAVDADLWEEPQSLVLTEARERVTGLISGEVAWSQGHGPEGLTWKSRPSTSQERPFR